MTILFAGMAFYMGTLFKIEQRSRDASDIKKELVARAQKVFLLLKNDETTSSNHLFDEFWLEAQEMEGVTLQDISSKLNLNWVKQSMLLHLQTALLESPQKLFPNEDYPINDKDGGGKADFNNYRDDFGPVGNPKSAYSKFIDEEVYDEFFTEYCYFNFNITDEEVHGRLYAARGGSESRVTNYENYIKAEIRALEATKNNKKSRGKPTLVTPQSLQRWMKKPGLDPDMYDRMFPLLNAEPVMNIHFVPEALIAGILSYKPFGMKNAAKKRAELLVKAREDEKNENGLTRSHLNTILGQLTYPADMIYHYFGFITWFWEIKATEGPYTLRWIIARIPPKTVKSEIDGVEFKLIREEFTLLQDSGEKTDITDEEGDEEGDIDSLQEDESENNEDTGE